MSNIWNRRHTSVGFTKKSTPVKKSSVFGEGRNDDTIIKPVVHQSLAKFSIGDSNDITENGEIIATALKTEEYTDEEGETRTREILVNIKLDPIEGELNNCTDNEEPVERQGAAVGLGSLLGFGVLGLLITGIRRRTFLKTKKS